MQDFNKTKKTKKTKSGFFTIYKRILDYQLKHAKRPLNDP